MQYINQDTLCLIKYEITNDNYEIGILHERIWNDSIIIVYMQVNSYVIQN